MKLKDCWIIGMAALVLLAGCGGRGGDRRGTGGSAHCTQNPLGYCYCDDTTVFDAGIAQCTPASVGEHAICCEGSGSCSCRPITCGIESSGNCLCGSLLPAFTGGMTSCTGTATTCCTQDTGYCYCEDGCEMRFGNRIVSSCDITSDTIVCDSGDTQVSFCE